MTAQARAFAAIERTADLVSVAISRSEPRLLLRQGAHSLAALRLTRSVAFAGFAPRSLIDVGANKGQFACTAAARWPGLEVVAFEPLPEAAARLRRNLPQPHRVLEQAVGDIDGNTTLYPHAYSLSTSVLRATDMAVRNYQWAKELPPINVSMTTLDSALQGTELVPPVLLKLDVQGLEERVLRGGQRTLERVGAVIFEQAFEPYYEGQSRFELIHKLLETSGFRFSRILDTRREMSSPVEGDFFYVRN